jgi:transcriptional regulator with XRE-family HTH domain
MAKRGDPSVLRLLVSFLRNYLKMTQEQFGDACGVSQPDVSLYETGQQAPSEATLRRMAKAAGIDWSLVVNLRRFYSSFLAANTRQRSVPASGALDVTSLEPVLLAVTPYLLELQTLEPPRPSPEEELREAEEIWQRLEKHPIPFRRRLIELSPRSGSWALAVRACEASREGMADERLELADLALSIAERAPGEEGWYSRLNGYCWAYVAKAREAANDFTGAGEALARARELCQGADAEMLTEGRLVALQVERDGSFRLVWEGLGANGQGKGLRERRYNSQGNSLEEESSITSLE